jgi:hypothetical protein
VFEPSLANTGVIITERRIDVNSAPRLLSGLSQSGWTNPFGDIWAEFGKALAFADQPEIQS